MFLHDEESCGTVKGKYEHTNNSNPQNILLLYGRNKFITHSKWGIELQKTGIKRGFQNSIFPLIFCIVHSRHRPRIRHKWIWHWGVCQIPNENTYTIRWYFFFKTFSSTVSDLNWLGSFSTFPLLFSLNVSLSYIYTWDDWYISS